MWIYLLSILAVTSSLVCSIPSPTDSMMARELLAGSKCWFGDVGSYLFYSL